MFFFQQNKKYIHRSFQYKRCFLCQSASDSRASCLLFLGFTIQSLRTLFLWYWQHIMENRTKLFTDGNNSAYYKSSNYYLVHETVQKVRLQMSKYLIYFCSSYVAEIIFCNRLKRIFPAGSSVIGTSRIS